MIIRTYAKKTLPKKQRFDKWDGERQSIMTSALWNEYPTGNSISDLAFPHHAFWRCFLMRSEFFKRRFGD
ncbi:MAG: hypothetical protein LBH92_04585 [Bacteroidales bacterium]|jgi:hypothetical protein|nr:hypothetical protein [Bacteroidales bacterium]